MDGTGLRMWWPRLAVRHGAVAAALTMALAMTPVGGALAGPIEDGVAAYERGNVKAARRHWEPLAERGDPAAQYWIGRIHFDGRENGPEYGEAMRWYRKAADQGHAPAQFAIGLMYREGRGVATDKEAAVLWFVRAGAKGEHSAALALARMYRDGEGVRRDLVQSCVWFDISLLPLLRNDPRRVDIAYEREAVTTQMTPAQVAEAKRQSEAWRPAR